MTINVTVTKDKCCNKTQANIISNLCGGTLELQQHQGTCTFQDVEVKQKRFLPVV